MRKIKDLVENREKVWVHLESKEVSLEFLSRAEEEGFHFGNGAGATHTNWGHVMALHNDMTLAHLPVFVWQHSFVPGVGGVPLKVEYKKYIDGEEDYICHKSYFTSITWQEG